MSKEQYPNDEKISVGMWRRVGKKSGKPYLGGSMQNYYVNYFKNNNPEKKEGDPDGWLKLYPVDKNDPMASDGISIGLWVSESKKGTKYVRGRRGGQTFNLFVNEQKKAPKQPDYNLLIYKKDEKPIHYERTQTPEMPATEMDDPSKRGQSSKPGAFDNYPDVASVPTEFIDEPEEDDDDVF